MASQEERTQNLRVYSATAVAHTHTHTLTFIHDDDITHKYAYDTIRMLTNSGALHYCVYLFQLPVPDGALTESEIENVSREVRDHVELLAKEMEMEYSLEEAKKCKSPSQDFAYSLIADFAESKDGTRNKLVQFLRSANFPDTARR